MSFWDGTRWVPDDEVRAASATSRSSRPSGRLAILLVLGLMLALPLQGAFAASKTGATLSVVFTTAPASGSTTYVPYTVAGCGYSAVYGGVTVVVSNPYAISFAGQIPDANGCIAVTNFTTQGPGTYNLTSYQTIHNKSQAMAKFSFTLN